MSYFQHLVMTLREQFASVTRTDALKPLVWIAHCKELTDLPVKRAPNRIQDGRAVPCDDLDMRDAIFEAFKHFKMLCI